jgi:hypothetical protein
MAEAYRLLADALWLKGDLDGMGELEPVLRAPPASADGWGFRTRQARLALTRGDLALAGSLAAEELELCAGRVQLALPEAHEVLATIRTRQGRWEEAVVHFQTAASLAHSMPYPWLEARMLLQWGHAEMEDGDYAGAAEHLAAAGTIFDHLGAEPFTTRTSILLHQLVENSGASIQDSARRR